MEKTLYPKTTRFGNNKIVITEKLDGSNLGFFKLNGELIIAQRNNIYKQSELNATNAYKGLIGWLNHNLDKLDLIEGSGIFGEWIGMGKIGYGEALDKKFYIFAKANINEDIEVRNIIYKQELFIYPFSSKIIPECIGIVPFVAEVDGVNIPYLDELYEKYCKQVERSVEGFIINNNNNITKYVRFKNGNQSPHIKRD